MLKIYETVAETLKRHYKNKPPEFQEGVKIVMGLFEVGIRKSTQFNLAVKVKELEKELQKRKQTIEVLRKVVSDKQEKIFELTLISGEPVTEFKEYVIPLQQLEGPDNVITIVTNMDSETIKTCILNFLLTNTFKRADEAKSKLLSYINNKRHLGFYAYKNLKVYRKEHLNKKK